LYHVEAVKRILRVCLPTLRTICPGGFEQGDRPYYGGFGHGGQATVDALAQALRTIPAPNMTKVMLGEMFDRDMSPVLSALLHGSFPRLKIFYLHNCTWSSVALHDLAEALRTKLVVLGELHLCECKTEGGEDLGALAEAFEGDGAGGEHITILRVCCSEGIEPFGTRVAAVISAGGLPNLDTISNSSRGMQVAEEALRARKRGQQGDEW
jgi:hypothetical protein